ncbi:DUF317 domain-containing protein [Streptomyces sp. Wh19]|uniref:DUF317 domain-containing protein n=1 Tax=Streptomyces sp. Wh19 TaxID=3076629 RepID=UPI00295849BF|nr:DUF317 domain-containing protein [Streptomyces sp. Wh19]MDV9196054.1 DUF317 domain-containing protein [Streptomyces sp. Wh19]
MIPYLLTRAADPRTRIWFETRPRHLAGGGDPRRITQTLRAAGWKSRSDPDYPHVALASPDYQHSLLLEPGTASYSAWWRICGQDEQSSWYTEFGGNIPVEILSALTDALLRPAPETTPDVWPALTSAGWTYQRYENGNETASHPDGILSLRRWTVEPAERFYWTAEAVLPNGGGGESRLWSASLDDRMPPHLLAAFANALASNEPVQRGMYDVPHNHLVTQEARGPQGEELAAAHEDRLKAVRTAVRKARRLAAPQTQPAVTPSMHNTAVRR